MRVSGFDSIVMRRVFNTFLKDRVEKNGKRRLLNTRIVSFNGDGNNPNLSISEMKKENELFKNDMAFLYIKTFWGRTPSNFKTLEYKMESERFNLFIKNYHHPLDLQDKIDRCMRRNSVDFVHGELPLELFYDRLRLNNIGLYTDDSDHRLFISPNFATHARIYINPSMKDYRHIVMYIMEQVAHREMGVGFKTRMDKIKTSNTLNNLILYTNVNDFPALIDILNNYEKLYPDKVSQFGDTFATLGRAKSDWFGFGFEPQRSNIDSVGLATFNSVIDDMFNNYVLTASMLDDFNDITSVLKFEDVVNIFLKSGVAHDKSVARGMALSLYDSKLTNQIINNFCNLSYVRNSSLAINMANVKIPTSKRRGLSPSQIRNDKDKPSDIKLLNTQMIEFPLYDGGLIMISRQTLAQLLTNPQLRECMLKFYSTTGETDRQVAQMAWLWNYLGKQLPYLHSACPFLSDDLVLAIKAKLQKDPIFIGRKNKNQEKIRKSVESKEKEMINNVALLCSDNHVLASSLIEISRLHPSDLRKLNKKEMQKKLITTIGLDKVIESVEFFKSQHKDVSSLYHFQTALKELRQERGMQLVEKLKETRTRREREIIAEQLSRFAREDIIREYQNEKAMQKFDDFVKSLYY